MLIFLNFKVFIFKNFQVVRDYDPAEYVEVLKNTKQMVEEQRNELDEIKQAKLLRK